jgi:hypothetical protein
MRVATGAVVLPLLDVAADHAAPPAHVMPFEFGFDAQLRAETGTKDILNGVRLAFWAKDHVVGRLERGPQAAHPIAMGFARTAELLLLDVPLAAEATVFPHEIFGHGARYREFGGSPSFHFSLPPPYSFTPSFTRNDEPITVDTPDSQTLIFQSGIVVEGYAAHAVLVSSFEADTMNHIDSGLLFGEPIHEVFEAILPWSNNDVRRWTTLEASRYRLAPRTLQRQYLVASAITSFANPTFLYSAYDLFWRFLVRGERTGSMPSLRAGEVALWAHPRVTPLPWGLEYRLDLLARWRGRVLDVAPHWGHGPGGRSAGIDVDLLGLRVLPDLVIGGGVSAWVQPELDLHEPTLGPIGVLGRPHSQAAEPGARFHAEVRWEHEGWFLGLRIGAKTNGLSGLQPVAACAESVALAGLLLGRP